MTKHTPPAAAALDAPAAGPEPTQTAETGLVAPPADTLTDSPADRLLSAALSGSVKFYRVRANGSTRAVPYLAPDTEAREVAEWIALSVDEGLSVAEVAEESGLSRATVRRALAAIELADEVEWDGSLSEVYEEGTDAIFLSALEDPDNVQFEVVSEDEPEDVEP